MSLEALPALFTSGDSPVVAAAIHDGHAVRPEVAELLSLEEHERLREQDPFTGDWTVIAPNRIVGRQSRFEVDLNRPRQEAVYLRPEQAWGLKVWKEAPPSDVVARSLALHDAFYEELRRRLDEQVRRWGAFVVFDLHSYNHRREGPAAPAADAEANPDINVGTSNMPAGRWGSLVERFISDFRRCSAVDGRPLDVRANVRFRGGYFARWIHDNYPGAGCALAIEVKKFFMDEWTGQPFPREVERVGRLLSETIPGVLDGLNRLR